MTGRAAENFFRANYLSVPHLKGYSLTDATQWGCGFDFKLISLETRSYLAVDVKGLREESGNIMLTDLEYKVADVLKERYFLATVCNFVDTPYLRVFAHPTDGTIGFRRLERKEVRTSWVAAIQ